MVQVNQSYLSLQKNYLFTEIAQKVRAYKAANPELRVISLGIGDVTKPLVPAVIEALHAAVEDMGAAAGFHGYGPEQGYAFLREAVVDEYARLGVKLDADEVFIGDGAKSDIGNFQELFDEKAVIAVTDPVYPVYVDSNAMSGRAGLPCEQGRFDRLVYLPCVRENGFVPDFPAKAPDVLYLCSPNNPTGTTLDRAALTAWVDYARKNGMLILYDAAYEAYITEKDIPHSIFEIEGAREVAVEFRSYSKIAGFTGLRCSATIVPQDLRISDGKGGDTDLNSLWRRRQCTKYNGCPYIVQKAAQAVHTEAGRAQVMDQVRGYLANATAIRSALSAQGFEVYGGVNAPYIWLRTPEGTTSWGFFDLLLNKAQLVCTPGAGFGASGEGYVRLTAFGTPEDTAEAISRLRSL
ncbi:MAG: LL-diaminopimelate aminotransferase [Desulfovibrionaceae bacterium]|nr:LL-diaminopimelate aminotransferase [Desulfovibrionaceae bacterium]